MTAAPYRVLDASHWMFENTGLQNGDLFGENTLHERIPGGASGHETDKRSASSPPNTVLLAKGVNPEDGGSEIVLHQPSGGGAVFSVGSITWVAALFPDSRVSTITKNVLRRFLDCGPAESNFWRYGAFDVVMLRFRLGRIVFSPPRFHPQRGVGPAR